MGDEILTKKVIWRRKREKQDSLERRGLHPHEQENVRRALQALLPRFSSLGELAKALGITRAGLMKAKSPCRKPGARHAVAVARVAGVPVDDVIAGRRPPPAPTCGGWWQRP